MTLLVLYPAAFLCAVAWGGTARLFGIDGRPFFWVTFALAFLALVLSARAYSPSRGARRADSSLPLGGPGGADERLRRRSDRASA